MSDPTTVPVPVPVPVNLPMPMPVPIPLPARSAVALLLALLLPACSASPPSTADLPLLPDTPVATLGGQPLRLGSLRGKVVLLDFWATWCVPCIDALPAYAELRDRHVSRGFEVVAVSVDQSVLDARTFIERRPQPYPVAYDEKGRLAAQLGVATLPSSFLIDQKGRIRHRYEGFDPKKLPELEARIEALLSE